MTNEILDIQPALRSLNVSVRGGRLTKFKGQVASLAPGLSVVATAAVLFAGGVDQAAAQALNACGPDEVGQDTVTCDAPTDPGTNPYAEGITYNNSDGLTLILNEDDITVRGSGARVVGSTSGEGDISMHLQNGKVITDGSAAFAPGLFAQIKNEESTASATAQVGKGGEVNTVGLHHYGVLVSNSGLGAATAEMDGDAVTTHGANTHALFAEIKNEESTATATARLIKGEITTTGGTEAAPGVFGLGAHGLFAQTAGNGAALAQMDGGAITTSGASARGLYAETRAHESTATVTARLTKGDISTGGGGADGLFALTLGTGAALAQMDGGTITTSGASARGLEAWIFNSDSSATVTARMTKGDINTGGGEAYGLEASTSGTGAALAQMEGGTVTTLGEDAYGLFASSNGGQAKAILGEEATVRVYGADADGIRAEGATGFDVDVAGRVTGGAGNGAAIRTISGAGGEIDIASGAIVTAGGSGIAIVDWNGDAVVTLEGTVTGDVLLGAGDDSLTIGATAIYDFSHILDGGSGDNDHLTLHGRRTMTSMENVTGWEHLTLKDEMEMRLDGVTTVDMGLSIDGRSAFRATGGEGGLTIRGDVTNNDGSVVLSVQNGETGDEIRIEGNYTGSDTGSDVFALDMGRDADGLRTDTVVITGDTSGEMTLLIAGMDSADLEGAPLVMDVVSVGGEANGTFTLVGGNYVTSDGEHAMISGAYLYRLAETDSGWALSALSEDDEITWQPASPLYDSYGASLLAFNTPASLRNRGGSSHDFRSLAWDGGAVADTAGQDTGSPLWVRMGTDQITSSEENSTTGAALESSVWEMEIGADIVLNDSAAGLLVGGLMLSYATGSTDVTSDFGDGSIDTTGLGLGLAATWYDARGFYVDGQVRLASYTSDLSSDSLGTLTEGNSGTGLALSIEAGQRLDLGSRLTVIPQAQLSLSSVAFSDFTSERREGPQGEAQQEQVALSEATSQRLRLGLEFGEQDPGASGLYGMVNLFHEFGAGSEVEVDEASLTTEHEPWAVGFGLGGTYAWSDRVDLFGEASYATGLSNAGDVSALSASAGFKMVF